MPINDVAIYDCGHIECGTRYKIGNVDIYKYPCPNCMVDIQTMACRDKYKSPRFRWKDAADAKG